MNAHKMVEAYRELRAYMAESPILNKDPVLHRWVQERMQYWDSCTKVAQSYKLSRGGQLLETFSGRGEAIQEALWYILGEGYQMGDEDEHNACLDLLEGKEVLGYKVEPYGR